MQLQLATDVVEFGQLCLLERRFRLGKVSARILHAIVEPQTVEVVADIVMMMDALARRCDRVRPAATDKAQNATEQAVDRGITACPQDFCQDIDERTGDFQMPVAERIAKCDTPIQEQAAQDGRVSNAHVPDGGLRGRIDDRAIPQNEADSRASTRVEEDLLQESACSNGELGLGSRPVPVRPCDMPPRRWPLPMRWQSAGSLREFREKQDLAGARRVAWCNHSPINQA